MSRMFAMTSSDYRFLQPCLASKPNWHVNCRPLPQSGTEGRIDVMTPANTMIQ